MGLASRTARRTLQLFNAWPWHVKGKPLVCLRDEEEVEQEGEEEEEEHDHGIYTLRAPVVTGW